MQKALLLVSSLFIYAISFFLLFQVAGEKVTALSLLPIVIISWLYGIKIGLAGAVLFIPINIYYLYVLGFANLKEIYTVSPGMIGSFFVASIAGYMGELQKKLKLQLILLKDEQTERKKAELALFKTRNILFRNVENISAEDSPLIDYDQINASAKLYREIAENAADIIYTVNKEGYFTYVNKMGEIASGYSSEELFKLKYTDLIQPGYEEEVKRAYFRQYLKRIPNVYIEFPFKSKHGQLHWFGQNSTLIYDNETITGFTIIARDITERKQFENALKESEELLRLITDTANDAIFTTDDNFIIIQWNHSSEIYYGYSASEIIGKPLQMLMADDEAEVFNLIVKNGRNFNLAPGNIFERKGRRKDGSIFPVEISLASWKSNEAIFHTYIIRDISFRKEAELKLSQSEERYRVLFENNPLPVIVRSIEDDSILAVNQTAASHYGYSDREFMSMKMYELVRSNTDIYNHNFEKGEQSSDKIYQLHVKKDHEIISVELSTYKLKFNERPAEIIIVNDITRRQKIEKEIIRQRDTAQRYLDVSAVLMCVLDRSNNIILLNKAGCRILGYSEEEVKGRDWVELCFKPADFAKMRRILSEIMSGSGEKHEYFEQSVITNYGQEKIIAFHNTAVYEEDSGISGILFSGEDITLRKNADKEINDYKNHLEKLVSERTEKLKEVNRQLFNEIKKLTEADITIQNQIEFFKTLINTIPLPVFIRNQEGIFIECNKAFETFFDISRKEVISNSIRGVFSEDVALAYEDSADKVSGGLGEGSFEMDVTNKRGEKHELMVYQAVIYKQDGTADSTISVILDITAQKNKHRETRHSLEKEKELNTLKSRFISTASHEFRTPLTTILASADLLEIMGPKWEEGKFNKHVGKIQNAVTYMTELIDDVLLINRAETGRLQFTPVEINLPEVIKEVIDNIKTVATESHDFIVNYLSPRNLYLLDNKLITQIISNLISNAVKYSPLGGEIKIKILDTGLNLKLEVSDNGIGISEDDVKHLFEPFQRGKNTGNIPGTGLGLSIVKKAVEIHGGEIFVNSIIEKGTTFTIILPVIENKA